jgi:hypothetical protein
MRETIHVGVVVALGFVLGACSAGSPGEDASPAVAGEDEPVEGETTTSDPFPEGASKCALSESAGEVRFQVKSAAGSSYCDGCNNRTTLSVRQPDGSVSHVANGFDCGRTACGTCSLGDCLEIQCFDYDTGNFEFTWNGAVDTANTCGDGVACNEICFVPEGEYELTYCTSRGTLTETDDNRQVCEKESGGEGALIQDCVTTTFSYPSEPGAEIQVLELGPN